MSAEIIAEELIVGWIHGQSMTKLVSEFHARSMPELLAEVLLVGSILVPWVATAEVRRALGPGCAATSVAAACGQRSPG